MESSTLEKIQGEVNNPFSNQNKNNIYGPPIIPESRRDFFKRKMKREFIYFLSLYSVPLMSYEYIRLYMLSEDKIIRKTIKNSVLNIFLIGTVYAFGSYYINYKPKEEIATIYEKKFQKEIIKNSQEDVMGNIKERKRVNLYEEKKENRM